MMNSQKSQYLITLVLEQFTFYFVYLSLRKQGTDWYIQQKYNICDESFQWHYILPAIDEDHMTGTFSIYQTEIISPKSLKFKFRIDYCKCFQISSKFEIIIYSYMKLRLTHFFKKIVKDYKCFEINLSKSSTNNNFNEPTK